MKKTFSRWIFHFSFSKFSYSAGKTKQNPDWTELLFPQGGRSCSNSSVNLQNHNSYRHQSSSEAPLSQRLIHQDRHEDSSSSEQRAEQKTRRLQSAGHRPAACYRCLLLLFSAGKNNVEQFCPDKMTEAALITFPSRISEALAHLLS